MGSLGCSVSTLGALYVCYDEAFGEGCKIIETFENIKSRAGYPALDFFCMIALLFVAFAWECIFFMLLYIIYVLLCVK